MAKYVGVATLRTAGHGLSDEGKRLMTIEAAQLDDLAVQLKTVVSELGFAKSDDARDLIDLASTAPERDIHAVEIGVRQIPQLDAVQIRKRNGVRDGIACRCGSGNTLRALLDHAIAFTENNFNSQRLSRGLQMLDETVDVQAGMCRSVRSSAWQTHFR